MALTKRALAIGRSFSGMTAALRLGSLGIAVDMVEIDVGWRSFRTEISLNRATLRLIRQLGLIDQFLAVWAVSSGVQFRAPNDMVVAGLPTPRDVGPDLPGGARIMRLALARILSDTVGATSVRARLGQTFTTIENSPEQVQVSFGDASAESCDLVIGADRVYSVTRTAVFLDAPKPRFIGQLVWRAVLPSARLGL